MQVQMTTASKRERENKELQRLWVPSSAVGLKRRVLGVDRNDSRADLEILQTGRGVGADRRGWTAAKSVGWRMFNRIRLLVWWLNVELWMTGHAQQLAGKAEGK